MVKQNAIKIFEEKKVRTIWDSETEEWYFSIVDVVAVLTESDYQTAWNYWKVLKTRLKKEGNESVTNCNRLKLLAEDGKMRLTDVATTEQLFRLIQAIPSPKAEPFKLWMAQVAKERLDQMQDPELSIELAIMLKIICNWKIRTRAIFPYSGQIAVPHYPGIGVIFLQSFQLFLQGFLLLGGVRVSAVWEAWKWVLQNQSFNNHP